MIKLKALLGVVAPTLGGAIGGPLGSIAIKAVASKLGVSPEETAVERALETATPEQKAALSVEDQAFSVRMRELDIDAFQVQTEDVQNARAVHSASGTVFPQIFASIFLLLFFSYIFLITISPPDQQSLALSNLIVGALMTVLSCISGYLYGSQEGNGKK